MAEIGQVTRAEIGGSLPPAAPASPTEATAANNPHLFPSGPHALRRIYSGRTRQSLIKSQALQWTPPTNLDGMVRYPEPKSILENKLAVVGEIPTLQGRQLVIHMEEGFNPLADALFYDPSFFIRIFGVETSAFFGFCDLGNGYMLFPSAELLNRRIAIFNRTLMKGRKIDLGFFTPPAGQGVSELSYLSKASVRQLPLSEEGELVVHDAFHAAGIGLPPAWLDAIVQRAQLAMHIPEVSDFIQKQADTVDGLMGALWFLPHFQGEGQAHLADSELAYINPNVGAATHLLQVLDEDDPIRPTIQKLALAYPSLDTPQSISTDSPLLDIHTRVGEIKSHVTHLQSRKSVVSHSYARRNRQAMAFRRFSTRAALV